MQQAIRLVGLDVHAAHTAGAMLDPASGEVIAKTIRGRPEREVLTWLQTLERPWRAVYEAGPTGYGLARAAADRGLDVVVCAPGHIQRHPSERVKTDRRDALKLARLLGAGELKIVRVPPLELEQLRDAVRCREDLRGDLMRARHRISKFCLRRGLVFDGPGQAWTTRHRDWLRGLTFDDVAWQVTFVDYLHGHDSLLARRDALDRALAQLADDGAWARQVGRLRCLRGIDTLTAVGLVAELGDPDRFARPKQLSAFLGLVPSEQSSGTRRRQGPITKAGSKHARRLLVEAAWHYRKAPRVSTDLARRQAGHDPAVIDLSWRCQRRLHNRWQHLDGDRAIKRTKVAVAVARELAAFCWELSRMP
jgi:transposase